MLNSLLNRQLLTLVQVKAIADNYLNVAQMMEIGFDKKENIVGKGENAGYQHFLLFQQCFPKIFFLGGVRSRNRVVKVFLW